MLNSNVLVLNRSYLPIHVTTVKRAVSLTYLGVARVVNEQFQTFDFDAWMEIVPTDEDETLGGVCRRIKVPRVIVLTEYDRVPRRHVRFSRLNIFSRDDFTCQYCGESPGRSGLNLDHVIPRTQGGRTTWENVVASCVGCNRKKGGRTPEQAGLRLRKKPRRPRWTPFLSLNRPGRRYREWGPFLNGMVDQRFADKLAG
ncbi:MAG: HNH endonuclease [Proteobacteria bacterium]|nr:HNH endonuclease [Pseudomonadota bacterium]